MLLKHLTFASIILAGPFFECEVKNNMKAGSLINPHSFIALHGTMLYLSSGTCLEGSLCKLSTVYVLCGRKKFFCFKTSKPLSYRTFQFT